MPTTYTPLLKVAKPASGELDGSWGDVVNNNITLMLEDAIAGRTAISDWPTSTITLTEANGVTSQARSAILDLSGTIAEAGTVICPSSSKTYIVSNNTNQTVTIKTAAGSGVPLLSNSTKFVFCDGTNVKLGVSDDVILINKTLQSATFTNGYFEQVFTITDNESVNLDPANGTIQLWTLGANRTPTATGFDSGQSMLLMVDDGASRDIIWSSVAVTWKTDGGSAPELNLTGFTPILLWKVDSTIFGARVGDA